MPTERWKRISKHVPPTGIRLKIKFIATTAGAPESEYIGSWESTGFCREFNGKLVWSVNKVKNVSLNNCTPSHWKHYYPQY
jgi:hypothetical protein